MRLARLVAAGLVLGALMGFLGALLHPRAVHTVHPDEAIDEAFRMAQRSLQAVS
jgi:hypothetical protein